MIKLKPCLCGRDVTIFCTSSGSAHETSGYAIECQKCGQLMTELPSNGSGRRRDAIREWNNREVLT